MNKILLITYYWPPSGGSGVQRGLKFIKYLDKSGISCSVLTVHPSIASYPITDATLEKDIPNSVKVFYTAKADRSLRFMKRILPKKNIPHSGFAGNNNPSLLDKILRFVRGNLFIPDARVGWNKYALQLAKQIIREHEIDTIITTSPPHSTQLIGLQLKQEFGIKWIMDIRDPWTEIYFMKDLYRLKWAQRKDIRLEKECVIHSDSILMVSNQLVKLYQSKYTDYSNKFEVIPNGYDEDDFKQLRSTIEPDPFTISYIGNLSHQYPTKGFIEAAKLLLLDPSKNYRFRFVGAADAKFKQTVRDEGIEYAFEFIPNVPHAEAIKYMLKSSVLLLIIPDVPENNGILTGKLFEYLAAHRPIVLLGPENGDAEKIVKQCRSGAGIRYSRVSDIADCIYRYTSQISISDFITHVDSNKVMNFSRKAQAEKLQNIISQKDI